MVFFRFFSQCFSLKKQCFQKLLRKICGIWCGAIFLPLQQSYTSTIMQQPKGTLQNLSGAVKQSVWEPCVCVCVCYVGQEHLCYMEEWLHESERQNLNADLRPKLYTSQSQGSTLVKGSLCGPRLHPGQQIMYVCIEIYTNISHNADFFN